MREDLGGHQLPNRPVGFRAVGDPLTGFAAKSPSSRVKNERTPDVLIGLFIKACTFLKVTVSHVVHDSIQVVTVQRKGHILNTSLNNTAYLHLNSRGPEEIVFRRICSLHGASSREHV